jgi:hypothetical protein
MAIYQDPNEDPTQGRGYPNRGYWDGTGHPPTTPTTPTTPPAPTDPWATPPADGDWKTWFLTNAQGMPATPSNLMALESKLKVHGIKVHRNAEGIAGKIILPGGEVVDVIPNAATGGGGAWSWQIGGGAASQTPITVDPTYLIPFNEQFQYADWQNPSRDAVYEDPGYQFRLNEGWNALENTAAARGLLNSGGTLAQLEGFRQNLNSQEYGNVWQRQFDAWSRGYDNAFRNWQARRDTHYANQNNPWSKLFQASNQGVQATV